MFPVSEDQFLKKMGGGGGGEQGGGGMWCGVEMFV